MSRTRNPTTELTLVRTVIEAKRLAPTVGRLTEALASESYADALEHVIDLQSRLGHMATIVTILRDWEDMSEGLRRKEGYGSQAARAFHRSARAGGAH